MLSSKDNFSQFVTHDSNSDSYPRMISRFFWGLLASLMPILTALLLKAPRIALDNFTDAVFYLSYARQFGELILRYGFPYYATRFGGILPDAIFGQLFGEIDGIWVLRWLLSAAVSLTLFLFFRKRYGLIGGILASLFWSLNPAVLRLLCTTYVDSTAVPFLIVGCCLFASGWGRNFGALLAGILLALATSAHLYAAFALILLVPWLIASRWENRPQLLKSLIWMAAGFIATFAAGWFWYAFVWQMPALFSPTIEVMKNLGGGQAALWKKPLSVALHETPAWFAPLVLLLPISIAALWGSFLLRGAALSLFASSLFFWGGDLVGNAYVLSMPFYYSFLLPVTILAEATLFGELLNEQERKIGNRLLVGVSILCLSVASVLVYSTGMFSQFLGHYPRNDIPVLELTSALRHELPKAASDGSTMRFWYDDDLGKPGGSDRKMIGAFWLDVFGKLRGGGDDYVPFAPICAEDAAALAAAGPDRIIVFDQDSGKVTQALEWIRQAELPYRLSWEKRLMAPSDRTRTLEVAMLEREKSNTQPLSTWMDLQHIQTINRGHLTWDAQGAELNSGSVKGWEFAKIPLGKMKKGEAVRLSFRMEQGRIRFSLHDRIFSSQESVEKWTIPVDQEISLIAMHDLTNAWLSLDSQYPTGSESKGIIKWIARITP